MLSSHILPFKFNHIYITRGTADEDGDAEEDGRREPAGVRLQQGCYLCNRPESCAEPSEPMTFCFLQYLLDAICKGFQCDRRVD